MPRKELREPQQIEAWLIAWGEALHARGKTGTLVLIGSAALLWHAYQKKISTCLSENSMDADPVTNDECVAELGYESGIGSEFEAANGWHINLMPEQALHELPADWKEYQTTQTYKNLTVIVPAVAHLLVPKIKRGEPRDVAHFQWARSVGLLNAAPPDLQAALREVTAQYNQTHDRKIA
jgi:hypothetical protein